MEFEDDHDEELEEEDDDEEITIPPPSVPPSYDSTVVATTATAINTNSVTHRPPRLITNSLSIERRSGVVRYRECLKNHAVNIGGHAVDGCCEFMAAGEEGSLDALKCAACNCHRNFHRKEIDPIVDVDSNAPPAAPTQIHAPFSGYYRTPPGPPMGYLHVAAPPPRGLSVVPTTSGGTHSGGDMADDMSLPSSSGGGAVIMREGGSGGGSSNKKRYRTKFTQDQKDKMLAFAEKLGWRIQKHDEAAVQQFCAEVQVKRQVLKVWMHNNKHTLGKKP